MVVRQVANSQHYFFFRHVPGIVKFKQIVNFVVFPPGHDPVAHCVAVFELWNLQIFGPKFLTQTQNEEATQGMDTASGFLFSVLLVLAGFNAWRFNVIERRISEIEGDLKRQTDVKPTDWDMC